MESTLWRWESSIAPLARGSGRSRASRRQGTAPAQSRARTLRGRLAPPRSQSYQNRCCWRLHMRWSGPLHTIRTPAQRSSPPKLFSVREHRQEMIVLPCSRVKLHGVRAFRCNDNKRTPKLMRHRWYHPGYCHEKVLHTASGQLHDYLTESACGQNIFCRISSPTSQLCERRNGQQL